MLSVIHRRLFSVHHSKFIRLLFSHSSNKLIIPKNLNFAKNVRYRHSHKPSIQTESPPGSRYMQGAPIELAEEFIQSALKNKVSMTDDEWDDFKSDLMNNHEFISEDNFSSIVMNCLLSSNQLDLSHSFVKYVENSNVKPNFLTYLKYLSLCSRNHRAVDQNFIFSIIDKVRKEIDLCLVLDVKRAEYIIQGLCATDKWKESFKYLDKLISKKPSREMCNAFACAAIRNNDEALAWEILMKWMHAYESVNDKVMEEFLLVALERQKINCRESDVFIEKVFQYMQKRDVIISFDVAKLVERYFLSHRLKWNITYTKVTRKGVCENCCHNLKAFELKDRELEDLRENFLQRSVMKSDIYINTNKREFANYMKFIEAHKPFHIVLDGLNAAHSCSLIRSRKNLSAHLLKIVRRLSGSYRKILVLGRKHMKEWPGIYRICDRAKLFFTDNISQDDPFLVYACLASGPYTLFLSDDLMRDHASRLNDPRLIHLFKRWQQSHQMYVQADDNNNGVKFIEPVRHGITVHGSMEHGWHIPFDDKIILDPYEELNNWLCIKKVI